MGRSKPVVYCPTCGSKARRSETRFGFRHECCGLHSWGAKALVSQEVHMLRQQFHASFDPLWKSRRMSRRDAYRALSAAADMPERDCHGAQQECPAKLRCLIAAAKSLSTKEG